MAMRRKDEKRKKIIKKWNNSLFLMKIRMNNVKKTENTIIERYTIKGEKKEL